MRVKLGTSEEGEAIRDGEEKRQERERVITRGHVSNEISQGLREHGGINRVGQPRVRQDLPSERGIYSETASGSETR